MKKVSFVNPNFHQGPAEVNAYYLPYASGLLWSYAQTLDLIREQYQLGNFVFQRTPIDTAVEQLKDSTVVAFSTYIWNKNYNDELAKRLKAVNPDMLIVFGGPEPAISNPDFFKHWPYIDICVKQEGEVSFQLILEALATTQDYTTIPGLLVNQAGDTVDTGPSTRIANLDQIPSPYLNGIFEQLIKDNPGVTWNTILETNRGCPYQCTFCDWGSLVYSKIKRFDLERVFAELEWCGQHGIDYISFADANFGIFHERDHLIAEKLVEIQKNYGVPRAYTIAWDKNQKRNTIDIVKTLMKDGSRIGLNVSVQSMDTDVLKIIKRNNMEVNKIKEIFALCEQNNIPLFTELILGLPGESLTSWKNNFYDLYHAGNHTGISVFQAQLLENAEMNQLQRRLYQIEGSTVYDYLMGSNNSDQLREGVTVITATASMPTADMLEAQVWSWFQNTFHISGLTNYISRFLLRHSNIEYADFYEQLYEWIKQDPWFAREIAEIRNHYTRWSEIGYIDYQSRGQAQIYGWNLLFATIIKLQYESNISAVFDLIRQFVLESFDLDPVLANQLIDFQQNYLIDYKQIKQYPQSLSFDYDFLGYIQQDSQLNSKTEYQFDFPEDKTMSLERFCDNIWYSRRRNFSKAWIQYKNTLK